MFVLTLRDVAVAVLCKEDFFGALAYIGSHGDIHDRRGKPAVRELAGGEIADIADERSDGVRVHFYAVRRPIRARLAERITLRTVVEFDLIRIGIAEIKKFLVPEIVEVLVEACSGAA